MADSQRSERRNISQLQKISPRMLPARSGKFLSQPPQPTETLPQMTPNQMASVLFDLACLRLDLKNLYIAQVCHVSESAVSKWRDPEYPSTPSLGQVAALGEPFLYALKQEQQKHFGWAKRALLDLVDAVGSMAEAVNL